MIWRGNSTRSAAERWACYGRTIQAAYFAPASGMNPETRRLYGANILSVTRQAHFSTKHERSVDTVLCVNEPKEIEASFQPYYERTIADKDIDYHKLYDLSAKLDGFHIYYPDEVAEYCRFFLAHQGREAGDDHAQMNRIIDAAVARFYEKTKDEKEEFRSLLGSFKNLYAFLAQIIPFYDTDLERLYCYLRALQLKLPWRGYSSPIDLDGKVALKYYRLQLISEGKIPLVKETQGAVYGPDEVGTGGEGISKEKLSKIIDILNEHFKTNFTSTDELLFESFKEDAEGDRQVREAAAVNTMDNFKYVFNHRLDDFVVDRLDQNGAIGARILNDPAFRKVVSDYLAQQVYDSIRGKMGLAEAKEKAHV